MKVTLLEPYGFCGGVLRALSLIKRAKKEHPSETIYLIGSLVHNEKVLESLKKDGFVLIDGSCDTIEERLRTLPQGSAICFSAHGHPSSYDEIAKSRQLIAYDATCPFVYQNERKIKESLRAGETVFFIGKKGHAEAEAVLSIDPKNVRLISPKEDIPRFEGKKVHVYSQTTMTLLEVEGIAKAIGKLYPDAIFEKTRCLDATRRQAAIKKGKDYGAILILGSKTSNNSLKLLEVAKTVYPNLPSYLCLDLKEAKELPLKGLRDVLLTSGASSSKEEVLDVKTYLESL